MDASMLMNLNEPWSNAAGGRAGADAEKGAGVSGRKV